MKYHNEVSIIKNGGVGIMPTDTIYGFVASAFLPLPVERLYELKGRKKDKPFIVLISSTDEIEKFAIAPDDFARRAFKKYWPGPVSIILPCADTSFSYLHRGVGCIAFRLPAQAWLREFLSHTGPLVAPSVNPEGLPPAKNISEAKDYFDEKVDFYIKGGEMGGSPSTIICLTSGREEKIR